MQVRVKIDENLPKEARDVLLRAGIDAVDVHEQRLGWALDPAIAAVCRVGRRAPVTLDAGFANIRTYPPEEHAGLIVLRLKSQDKSAMLALIERLGAVLSDVDPMGRLLIVRESGIRIRS